MRRSPSSVIADLGLEQCQGARSNGSRCLAGDHDVGFVTPGVIHYVTARSSWPGILRVLKLAAMEADPSINRDIAWRRVYRLNMAAREMGSLAHVRVPSKLFDLDKAFVKAGVAGVSNEVWMRKQAFDWARR